MTYPIRFVVCTYNLFNDQRWLDRQESLRKFLAYHLPDILCVQEFRPVARDCLDDALKTHQRVEDPFEGWSYEGNIYWHRDLFELVEYGAEDIGILEKLRRLFWVRLRLRGVGQQQTLLVATAHYSWYGNQRERTEGINPRIDQAQKTVETLNKLVPASEPLLFMGDLNDFALPIQVLHQGGLTSSFWALGRMPAPTWPAPPIAQGPPAILDWILHRGPIRPMTSGVVDFLCGRSTPV